MKIFFIGIKGVGMASLATLYKEWGHEVIGSDTDEEFFTDAILKDLSIPIVSFDAAHITSGLDKVIYSTAYQNTHPQIEEAKKVGVSLLSYGEALAEVFNTRKGIVVTGTHGKTTSTAMLGRVLEGAGFDPTVVCGGELLEWRRTARAGKSQWMVAEGDEYQAKFLMLKPYAVLLTNIEYDHPDFYPDEKSYREVFLKLLASIPNDGFVVAHESLREFVEAATKAKKIFFSVDESLPALQALGEHNRANASGVLALACELGADKQVATQTLTQFRGTRRRMELYTPSDAEVVIMDDYAHHPTEIRATLAALRKEYPHRNITALFQPHTYSRTKVFLEEFANAFEDADRVIILDVYASAREREKSISGEDFFGAVKMHHADAVFARSVEEAYDLAKKTVIPESVYVTLGAGDVWRVARMFATEAES